MRTTVLKTIVLISGSLFSETVCAQTLTSDEVLFHRWFVGAQTAQHSYAVIFTGGSPSLISLNPYQLNVGYQLTPRLAVQLGGLYRQRSFESLGFGATLAGVPTTSVRTIKSQNWAFPLNLRYTVTRESTKRLQVDGVLGLTMTNSQGSTRDVRTEGGLVVLDNSFPYQSTDTHYTGGISTRIGLGKSRHFELVGDLLLNRNTERFGKTINQSLNTPGGLTRSYNIGVQYRFRKVVYQRLSI